MEKMSIFRDGKLVSETTDKAQIYESIAGDLLHKKIHKCTYINRITDRTNYDGTRTVKVYYNNGVKRVYIISDKI